jgi:hypothetical protein
MVASHAKISMLFCAFLCLLILCSCVLRIGRFSSTHEHKFSFFSFYAYLCLFCRIRAHGCLCRLKMNIMLLLFRACYPQLPVLCSAYFFMYCSIHTLCLYLCSCLLISGILMLTHAYTCSHVLIFGELCAPVIVAHSCLSLQLCAHFYYGIYT